MGWYAHSENNRVVCFYSHNRLFSKLVGCADKFAKFQQLFGHIPLQTSGGNTGWLSHRDETAPTVEHALVDVNHVVAWTQHPS